MDYFKILNLCKEPFSNSPDPEFFYQSRQHKGCLQKLELAVRLHRGLNVVIGDVGTGKTTLCRQLILNFAGSEQDKEKIETHLLLDPSFNSPREFLFNIATGFGFAKADAQESEWIIKENIKNYLFEKGIDEGKIVVLIIDEGQKLPPFCLEILREFLNYETNDHKLLQIIIFAQREFKQILDGMPNFTDRINQYYYLEPLNFRETRAMIRFRLAMASESKTALPLFTYGGLRAIYSASGGYPRKIIALVHQVILSLIIQNRVRGGYFLVRSCARRVSAMPASGARLLIGAGLAALILFLVLIGLAPDKFTMDYLWQKLVPAINTIQENPNKLKSEKQRIVPDVQTLPTPPPQTNSDLPSGLGNLSQPESPIKRSQDMSVKVKKAP